VKVKDKTEEVKGKNGSRRLSGGHSRRYYCWLFIATIKPGNQLDDGAQGELRLGVHSRAGDTMHETLVTRKPASSKQDAWMIS